MFGELALQLAPMQRKRAHGGRDTALVVEQDPVDVLPLEPAGGHRLVAHRHIIVDALAAQGFARSLGAVWAGGSDSPATVPLDAAILFAPVGALVPKALGDVAKGGTVVCAGIHMSDIPAFAYARLWHERRIVSVANLTRRRTRVGRWRRSRISMWRSRLGNSPSAVIAYAVPAPPQS